MHRDFHACPCCAALESVVACFYQSRYNELVVLSSRRKECCASLKQNHRAWLPEARSWLFLGYRITESLYLIKSAHSNLSRADITACSLGLFLAVCDPKYQCLPRCGQRCPANAQKYTQFVGYSMPCWRKKAFCRRETTS